MAPKYSCAVCNVQTILAKFQVVSYILCMIIILLSLSSSVSSSSSLSWDFLLQKHARTVGKVSLTEKTILPDWYRRKRDLPTNLNDLPSTLTFSFTLNLDAVTLVLKKNSYIDASPPLYIVRNGKIVRDHDAEEKHDYAYYQDRDNGAAVMVRRSPDGQHYQVTGSYFHNGEEYAIQPIREEIGDDVDHRISKLFHQANLQYDVIDLGTDLLHVSSMESFDDDPSSNNSNSSEINNHTVDFHPNYANDTDSSYRKSNNSNNSNIRSDEIDGSKDSSKENDTSIESHEFIFIQRNYENGSKVSDWSKNSHRNLTDYENDDAEVNKTGKAKRIFEGKVVESDDDHSDDNDTKENEEGVKTERKRRKRQAETYVVELLMVIDYGVYEVWYDGVTDLEGDAKRTEAMRRIKQFYSFVLNGIDLRYSSVQRVADFDMEVTWAGIIVFDNPVPDYWKDAENPPQSSRDFVESSAALEAFRAWAEGQGEELPPSDHVLLFTGHNLTYGGSVSNAGLAYLGSACNPDYFFSIVEEYFEFRDVAIAAHELGHSLGARHDMDGNTCLSFDRYIMTSRFKFPSQRKAQNPWLFSKCSVDYFTDFIDGLDKNDTNCLVTKDARIDTKEIQPFLVSLPGEIYKGDNFCRLGDGPESYICRDQHIKDYSNVCYGGIYCYKPQEKLCAPKLPPDGFSCGNRKWCINGTCQSSELAPATTGDDCPFGDEPGLIGGKTCAERMLTSRSDCYRDAFRAKCCASCRRYRRNLPGCEYGDMFELCNKDQCINYEKEYALENCCDTCAELLFTIPTTIATTTTPTVPTSGDMSGNSSGNESGLSNKRENTQDKKEGKNNASSPNDSSEVEREGNVTEKGEEEIQGTPARRRTPARRGYNSDSSESDESDEESRSQGPDYTNMVDDKTGNRARSKNQPYTRDERMSQIRNLLDGMRNSRDLNRSQRMRLLVYILDRIRQEDLTDFVADLRVGEGRSQYNMRAGPMQRSGRAGTQRMVDDNADDVGDNDDDNDDSDSDSSNESR